MLDLDDMTIEVSHLAELLHTLVDMTEDCSPSLESLRRVSALTAIASGLADRNKEQLEQYHQEQIAAGKRAA